MSIYSPTDAPCGIYGDVPGVGMTLTLSFARNAAEHYGRTPAQSPAGEVLQSYIAIGPYTGEYTPNHGGLERTKEGVIIDIAGDFVVKGIPDIRELDRVYIGRQQLEVVAPNQFGDDHLECQLRWIGR